MSAATAAEAQLRVVHALALRETRTRFGSHQLGYLWAIVEPVLWVLTFWVVFSIAQRPAPTGMNIFTFIATGIVPYEAFTKTLNSVSESINGNRALLVYPQVQPLDLVYSRALLELATNVMVLTVLMTGNGLVTGEIVMDDPLHVLHGLILLSLFGMSVGMVFCMAAVVFQVIERIRGPLIRPLFWVSGLFYTVDTLPDAAQRILLYNPIVHCIELVRGGFFRSYSGELAEPTYVWVWIVGFLFLGLTLERVVRRRIQTV